MTALLLPCCLFAQIASSTSAKEKQASDDEPLRVATRNVLLDVTVMDKKGNPILNLGKEHFKVLEDGKPQPVVSFDEMGTKPPAPLLDLKLPPHMYSNIPSIGASESLYVLVLDSLNTSTKDQMYAHSQTVEFLNKLPRGSRIAIFGLSSRLYMLQGFTADPEVLQRVLNSRKSWAKASDLMDSPELQNANDEMQDEMADMPSDAAASANMQGFLEQQQNFQNELRVQRTLDAFNSLALYLSAVDGRKNVIWFAGNFPLNLTPDISQQNPFSSTTSYAEDLRKTAALLATKRIAIYPVDAQGVTVMPMLNASQGGGKYVRSGTAMGADMNKYFQETSNTHSAMQQLADMTGGKAFYNTNDLSRVLDNVMQLGKNYYLLSYSPPDKNYDEKFHRITVKVDIPGCKLLYRDGYYSEDPSQLTGRKTILNPDPVQASLIRGTPDTTQIPFKIRVLPADPQPDPTKPADRKGDMAPQLKGPLVRMVASWAINERAIHFTTDKEGRYLADFRVVLVANDADGNQLNVDDRELNVQLDKKHYLQYAKFGFQYTQELDLPKGEIFLRAAVVDMATNNSGSTEIPLLVKPDAKKKPVVTAATPDITPPVTEPKK
jgi:VWFA-related protein